jgi:2,3-bisphosphoglycerate-dependent phosphoglycerate mutase
MTVFYLVRHAHADWRPGEERPLSARGQQDARRVARVLALYPITALYSSPARRARQTILPLAVRLGLPLHVVPELYERRLSDDPVNDFLEAVRATWADPCFAFPGGEPNAAAQERAVELLETLLARHAGEHVVLSTHGNLLALLLQHFDPAIDFHFWQSLTMPDVYRLVLVPRTAACIRRLFGGAA